VTWSPSYRCTVPSPQRSLTTRSPTGNGSAEGRAAGCRRADAIRELSHERRKHAELESLRAQHKSAAEAIRSDKTARAGLVMGGGQERAARLGEISAAIDTRQVELDAVARRERALYALRDDTADVRARRAPALREQLEQAHAGAGLSTDEWEAFTLEFRGDVDDTIQSQLTAAEAQRLRLTGTAIIVAEPSTENPYMDDDADLAATPLNALRNEANRLQLLIGLDQRKTIQLRTLDDKIAKAEIALSKVAERITDAEGARARIKALNERRKAEYAAMFDAFKEEQEQLALLYEPLAASLNEAGGVLGNLVFTVRRDVDIERWAKTGEDLLDLRTGPFKGVGSLLQAAHEKLAKAWRHGSGTDAADAMAKFREEYDDTILEHAPAHARESQEAFWEWGADVASWLDSTDHIELRYGVQYDGVEIEQLSPGTRGIVLLLLYLSIDRNDDRPLIIDQPEENLDPKSVFEELVGEFRNARQRRQVIIVTHNANLICQYGRRPSDRRFVRAAPPE
jgi:hypothetical protein